MLSPKISQAKALVRFSGSEAARKAAGSEIRYRIAKCSQKFVCLLPAVCTSSKTHDSGSPRIAFVIESFIRNKNILLGQFPGTCGLHGSRRGIQRGTFRQYTSYSAPNLRRRVGSS
jgi:hypothetical protein